MAIYTKGMDIVLNDARTGGSKFELWGSMLTSIKQSLDGSLEGEQNQSRSEMFEVNTNLLYGFAFILLNITPGAHS